MLRPRRAPSAQQPAQPVSAATEESDSDEETLWFDAEEGVGEWFAAIAAEMGQEIGQGIGREIGREIGGEIGQGHGGEAGGAEEAAAAAEPQPPSQPPSPAHGMAEGEGEQPKAAEAAEAVEAGEVAAPKPDLLPLHRAAENLRLCMRRVRVRVVSDETLSGVGGGEAKGGGGGGGEGGSELLLGLQARAHCRTHARVPTGRLCTHARIPSAAPRSCLRHPSS